MTPRDFILSFAEAVEINGRIDEVLSMAEVLIHAEDGDTITHVAMLREGIVAVKESFKRATSRGGEAT